MEDIVRERDLVQRRIAEAVRAAALRTETAENNECSYLNGKKQLLPPWAVDHYSSVIFLSPVIWLRPADC